MHQAHGTFEVELTPQPPDAGLAEAELPRLVISKTFAGDLEGSSVGLMIAVRTAVDDSAGYVAMERVSGSLAGRTGTFVLQHSSTIDRGAPTQSVTVVPDSATGELAELTGSMIIYVGDDGHRYTLEYQLG
jgi:hypothetical protein